VKELRGAAGENKITDHSSVGTSDSLEQETQHTGLFQSVRPVTRAGAIRDALAGLQLAAMNIPQVLGYTKIAGTPIITGFYTLLLPLVAFAAFGSSRYLVVAADSATAAILAGGLGNMAPLASARYVELAGLVALLSAVLLLLARLLKLGFVADFLSQTVLVGFLTGVGFQVGIAVLGEMVGVEVRSRRTVGQFLEVLRGIRHIHWLTALLSVIVITVVIGLNFVAPRVPGSLIVVVGAVVASARWDLARRGVAIIGPITGGLPHFTVPSLASKDVVTVLPLAASCLIVILTQSAATARFYAARHDQRLEEDADLLGLAAANAAAAFSGTFVVDGSPTQTAMVEGSGGQSQLAQLVTAGVVVLVLVFLTKPLEYLPRCVLGAVVFVIAVRLVRIRSLRSIRQESPGEYALALLTAAIVVLVGVEQGIVIAMVLSLLLVVKHSYRPQTSVLVLDKQGKWEEKPPAPGACTESGVVIYHFGAGLFYANAGRFSFEIRDLATARGASPVRGLVIDAEAIPNIDYTAAQILRHLHTYLQRRGIDLGLARVAASLRSDLVRHQLVDLIGEERIFPTLHDALAGFRNGQPSNPAKA
jgi:sulfate permease, SulP family